MENYIYSAQEKVFEIKNTFRLCERSEAIHISVYSGLLHCVRNDGYKNS
jgi:hypothetical protein